MSIWHLHRFTIRLWHRTGLGRGRGHDRGLEERFNLQFANGFPYIHTDLPLKAQMPRFPFQRGNPRHP